MPPEGVVKLKHSDILSYEEMLRLAHLGRELGLEKLRLTGGEPLVRRGLSNFISRLHHEVGFEDIRLTTNGILLPPLAPALKEAGLSAINISLDAVNPEIYAKIVGLDNEVGLNMARKAWEGFHSALSLGFKTKINCVPVKGTNDEELPALARLIFDYPIEVRFIEHMPIGEGNLWQEDRFLSSDDLLELLERELGPLEPVRSDDPSAPARLYRLKGAKGLLGFISPLSGHFCSFCNRLRITADGRLKPCLLTNLEIDLRGLLRSGATDDEIRQKFLEAAEHKPANHFQAGEEDCVCGGSKRSMSRIGG